MTVEFSSDELRACYTEQPFSVFSVGAVDGARREELMQGALYPSFLFTLSGRASVVTDAGAFEASPGAAVHQAAGAGQRLDPLDGEPYEAVFVSYVSGHRGSSIAPSPTTATWVFRLPPRKHLSARLRDLESLGRNPDLESRLNQIIGATSLIKDLFQETGEQPVSEGLRRARSYLEEHYAEPLTMQQLGSIAGLSPKSFSERFAQAYGTRPLAYLINRRLDHADELLAGGMLVKETARMVGYEDPFYFSRIYKKYRGVSPEAARQRLSR